MSLPRWHAGWIIYAWCPPTSREGACCKYRDPQPGHFPTCPSGPRPPAHLYLRRSCEQASCRPPALGSPSVSESERVPHSGGKRPWQSQGAEACRGTPPRSTPGPSPPRSAPDPPLQGHAEPGPWRGGQAAFLPQLARGGWRRGWPGHAPRTYRDAEQPALSPGPEFWETKRARQLWNMVPGADAHAGHLLEPTPGTHAWLLVLRGWLWLHLRGALPDSPPSSGGDSARRSGPGAGPFLSSVNR